MVIPWLACPPLAAAQLRRARRMQSFLRLIMAKSLAHLPSVREKNRVESAFFFAREKIIS
jgi:hypothetical protein